MRPPSVKPYPTIQPVRLDARPRSEAGGLLLVLSARQLAKPVRPEAGPVILPGNDDGDLLVAHGLDGGKGGGVGGDIQGLVLQAGLVQNLVGCRALNAIRLAVDLDRQVVIPLAVSC